MHWLCVIHECWRFFFWVAWNKKRTEIERDEMVLEPGEKMKIVYDQQSVNNVCYSQHDTLKGWFTQNDYHLWLSFTYPHVILSLLA